MIDPIRRPSAAVRLAAATLPFFACLLASGNSLAEAPRPLFFDANSMGAWKPDAFRASLHPAPARIVCDGDVQAGPIDRNGPGDPVDPWRPEKGDQETATTMPNKWTFTFADWGHGDNYVLCYPHGAHALLGPARDEDIRPHGPVVKTLDNRKNAVPAKERWLIPTGSPIKTCIFRTQPYTLAVDIKYDGPTICE